MNVAISNLEKFNSGQVSIPRGGGLSNYGATQDVWPSVCPHFNFWSRSRKPMWVFLHIAHTHPLGGVNVLFRGYLI